MAESRFASQQSQPGEWGRGNCISSFPSSAAKIYIRQNFRHGSDKHGPGTIKCSPDSLFTRALFCRAHHRKIKFWYGKIKFWYDLWAQFFGQHTKKSPLYACGTFYSNMEEEKCRESFLIKRADLCNRDQCDQQRSINLFH